MTSNIFFNFLDNYLKKKILVHEYNYSKALVMMEVR